MQVDTDHSFAMAAYRTVVLLTTISFTYTRHNQHGSFTFFNLSINSSQFTMDIDLLISPIESRPVLWDKTSNMYKDRNEIKKEQKKVYTELNSDFNNYDDEKNKYDKLAYEINFYKQKGQLPRYNIYAI